MGVRYFVTMRDEKNGGCGSKGGVLRNGNEKIKNALIDISRKKTSAAIGARNVPF